LAKAIASTCSLAKTCRESQRGGKVALTTKRRFRRANGRKRPPARHEGSAIWRWKAPWAVDTAFFSRGSWRDSLGVARSRLSRKSRWKRTSGATGVPEARSSGRYWGGQCPDILNVGPAEAVFGVVKTPNPPYERTAEALRRVGSPRGAGARSRECWEADVGQTHRVSSWITSRKARYRLGTSRKEIGHRR